MRLGISIIVLGVAAPAFAEPRVEGSGFVGVDYLGDRVKLGSDWRTDGNRSAAPLLGARLSILTVPVEAHTEVAIGIEGEAELSPTYTIPMSQTTVGGSHTSYFAPTIGWRAHGIFRVGDERFAVHAVVGGGGETVMSKAPFIKTQTEPLGYWGVGMAIGVGETGQLRFDGRNGYTTAAAGGYTSVFELQVGLAVSLGPVHRAHKPVVEPLPPVDQTVMVKVKPPVDPNLDSDHDGFPDSRDMCPFQAETVNGIDDDDGCPEFDPDHDGIVGAADKCPDEPEDFDHFQDEDGCPEPDNDHDGIADAADRCPNESETINGFQDLDGCPDDVPAPVKDALRALGAVKFEANRAKVIPTNNAGMQKALELLKAMPDLRVVVVAHPDKEGDKPLDVAKRRTEALKWYLLENGMIDTDRITTKTGAISAKGPAIEVELVVAAPTTGSPAPGPSKIATPVPPKP